MRNIVEDFERKVLGEFEKVLNLESDFRIGAAVSGGADSISLLVSLVHIFGAEKIFVVNVNHRIREKSETDGDSLFVLDFCRKLGVECEIFQLQDGEISELCEKRGGGVEEAARFRRYEIFEDFIREKNLDFLCLAHNQNDQLETILMRFLQGTEGNIKKQRGKYFRPLLEIPRAEIEAYLNEQKISWRTDSTNLDNDYFRNKIRNILVPKLDEILSGWKNGVLSFAEKNSTDSEFIEETALDFQKKCGWKIENGKCSFDSESFLEMHPALRRRIIFSALNKIGIGGRIPFKMIRPILFWKNDGSKHKFSGMGIEIFEKKSDGEKRIFIQKKEEKDFVSQGFYFLVKNEEDLLRFRKMISGFPEEERNSYSALAEKMAENGFPFALNSQ